MWSNQTLFAVIPVLFVAKAAVLAQQQQSGLNRQQGTLGAPCAVDAHCTVTNAVCLAQLCSCARGHVATGTACIAPTEAPRCAQGQVYVSEAGTCMNNVRPGAPCQYSQQCSDVEMGAFCVAQRCRCVYGMVVTSGARCTFINANCTERGTVWISELGACRPVIAPGGRQCSHEQQCQVGIRRQQIFNFQAAYADTTCFMQQCTCPVDAPVAVDGTCGRRCPDGQTFSGVLNRCLPCECV